MHRFFGIAVSLVFLVILQSGCAQQGGGPAKVTDVSGVKNLSRDGRVYVAGTPTAEGLDQLKQRGVKTVIDLRMPQEVKPEEVQAAKDRGMTYVSIPMQSDKLTDEQMNTFMDAMRQTGDEPVLVHCAGASRAGAMYGLYLGKSGQCPAEEAVRRAKAAGLKNEKLEGDVKNALQKAD